MDGSTYYTSIYRLNAVLVGLNFEVNEGPAESTAELTGKELMEI